LFPGAAMHPTIRGVILTLAVVGIVYGALVALVQPDFKKLVAYSSVSHLGFVMLGIFALTPQSVQGALMVNLSHGVSTGALFLMIGMIYERRHTRRIADFGGLWNVIPVFSVIFLVVMLSSIGLPGTNGFVGEFLVLLGAFQRQHWWAVLAATGVILSACYMLWMYQRVFFGTVDGVEVADSHGGHGGHDDHAHGHDAHAAHGHDDHGGHGHDSHGHGLPDLNLREWACVIPLVVMMVWMGMYSQSFLPVVSTQNARILDATHKGPQASNVKITPVAGGNVHAR